MKVMAGTILMVLVTVLASGQVEKRTYTAIRTSIKPKIDGKPNDEVWSLAAEGNAFRIVRPENGQSENKMYRTVIKILYDDNALYVAAFLYDSAAEMISAQFSKRDETNVQADLFSFWINTYNNQIEQTRFYISAAGAVADSRAINGDEDFSYNVVFSAKSSRDKNGWYVEMEIPYQALRFPKSAIQNWSFNAFRRINRINQTLAYNFINVGQGNEAQYDAQLLGVINIRPPVRLSLFPFAGSQYKQLGRLGDHQFTAGLDFKVGLTDAFTFDATLIPDFGQVAFDDIELNLSPFEQVFEERRPFFSEGTELFSKGNLLYSRRIGQLPSGYGDVAPSLRQNEIIEKNPIQAQLLNAVKFSGRTKSKLGIGLLNAITNEANAILLDTLNKSSRKLITEPLTNYNLFVLDKQYRANSSFYFSNASTVRKGVFRDANVVAAGINHYNRANTFNYSADISTSNRKQKEGIETGFSLRTRWQKVIGKWRYGINYSYLSKLYNPNDLGLQLQNNINTSYIFGTYNQFTPKGSFNNYTVNFNVFHSRTNQPGTHNFTQFSLNPGFETRRFWQGGAFVTYFTREYDFFESRIQLLPVRYQPKLVYGIYLTSDVRKKISIFTNLNAENRFGDPEQRIDLRLRPSIRFSQQLFFQYQFFWQNRSNRLSFVALQNNESVFSLRRTRTVENLIQVVYNFNPVSAVNLRVRNFWSSATFADTYRRLIDNGRTVPYTGINLQKPDTDFNAWNLDCSYEWQFAPASSLVILYRNVLSDRTAEGNNSYLTSIGNLFQLPLEHTLSVRFNYFIDVNRLTKNFK